MGRNLDPGRKGCVLRLDRRLRRTPLAHMGGDKLGIDAGRIDDGEAGILVNEHVAEDGPVVFAHACRLGAEGIVSKKVDGTYRSGPCPVWIKVSNPASITVQWARRREAEQVSRKRRPPLQVTGRSAIASQIAPGLQVSPLLGLFASFGFHFDGRGPWFALRRTSIWCPHSRALSGSRKAIPPGGSAAQPKLRESR